MTQVTTGNPTPTEGGEKQKKGHPSFAWLMAGGFISMLGDQFSLIGLPWLTLKVTGDTLAVGLVFAIVGIPRAAFILLGGAIVDKYSPKSVLLVSKYVNTLLLGLLAFMVYKQTLTLPALYALAGAIGLASAFAIPAGTSILPFVVPREKFAQANGLMMGMRQVTMFLGPVIAGLVIAAFGSKQIAGVEAVEDTKGLALVFALDALSFLLSAFTLAMVHLHAGATPPAAPKDGVFRLLASGIREAFRDLPFRTMMLYMALIQLFVVGPMQVGLPVFAETRLDGGAASFGIVMGGHGFGVLIGVIAAGAGLRFGAPSLGWLLLCVDTTIGLIMAGFGMLGSTELAAVTMAAVGMLGGMVQVRMFGWLQGRTAPAQMGRVMSLFMFIVLGIAPVSAFAGGWVLRHTDIVSFFVGCGLTMTAVALSAMLLIPSLRHIGAEEKPAPSEA